MAGKKSKRPTPKKTVSQKRKRRPRRTSLTSRLLWLIPVFFLAAAAFWLTGGPAPAPEEKPAPRPAAYQPAAKQTKPISPPVFEEPLPAPSQADRLEAMDKALFKGLSKAGVDLSRVETKLVMEDAGEISALHADLGPKPDIKRVKRALEGSLKQAKADYAWQRGPTGEELVVSLDGLPTHRLTLTHPRQLKTPSPGKPAQPPASKPGARPLAALVIDDLGYQMEPAKRLLALDVPITFSILPHSPHGKEIAVLARKQGREVLLHLPMEPKYASLDPGPGALMSGMSPQRLREIVLEDLATVPGAAGANNHMGSKLTQDLSALTAALGALGEKGLFFLDSRTSADTVAVRVAKELGLAWAERDVFLDHDPKPKAVRRQLDRMIYMAKKQGRVIAIGHPHPATLDMLEKYRSRPCEGA